MKKKLLTALLVLAATTVPVHAALTYGFEAITFNDSTGANGAIGERQLFVDVEPLGSSQALFTFRNTGPEPSSITDIYFYDGALLGIAKLIDADENGGDENVNFSEGAKMCLEHAKEFAIKARDIDLQKRIEQSLKEL